MSQEFRFFIRVGSTDTPIDEPIGWADATESIQRSEDFQGFFSTLQIGELEYTGVGYLVVVSEFNQLGVDAQVQLYVEFDCGQGWQPYYLGWLDFLTITTTCDCRVRISHDQQSDEKAFLTRRDQPVDLESLEAFDGEALDPYFALGNVIQLPSKAIKLTSRSNEVEEVEFLVGEITGGNVFNGDPDWPFQDQSQTGLRQGYIFPQFPNVTFSEIGLFQPGSTEFIQSSELEESSFLAFLDTRLFGCGYSPLIFRLQLKGFIQDQSNASRTASYQLVFIRRSRAGVNTAFRSAITLSITSSTGGTNFYDFDINIDEEITVSEGDLLFVAIFITYNRTSTGAMMLKYWQTDECFIELEALSKCPTTPAKVFAINEVFSRITEAYTGGNVRALSSYFGRTDSEPYSQDADGCGGLEVLTNGLFIRNVQQTRQNQPPQFTASFLDVMRGMEAIHNIGAGIELDPNRPGSKVIRVEPYRYFYQDTVMFEALDVNSVEIEIVQSKAHSLVDVGYAKWEAEAFNGLDEFLTNRKYRTTLKNSNLDTAAVNAVSALIASGYAIELTRRQSNDNSADWRYDNDRFIICVERFRRRVTFAPTDVIAIADTITALYEVGDTICFDYSGANAGCYTITEVTTLGAGVQLKVAETVTAPEVNQLAFVTSNRIKFGVELGKVTNPQNIIDPNSVYNYRITPYRNLLRWAYRIFECYFPANDKRLLFAEGTGNYYAEGLLDDDCAQEAVEVAENQEVVNTVFKDTSEAESLMTYQLARFSYPVREAEREEILSNPYRLVRFTSDGCDLQGWLVSMTRRTKTGLSDFVLRLKAPEPTDCTYRVEGIESNYGRAIFLDFCNLDQAYTDELGQIDTIFMRFGRPTPLYLVDLEESNGDITSIFGTVFPTAEQMVDYLVSLPYISGVSATKLSACTMRIDVTDAYVIDNGEFSTNMYFDIEIGAFIEDNYPIIQGNQIDLNGLTVMTYDGGSNYLLDAVPGFRIENTQFQVLRNGVWTNETPVGGVYESSDPFTAWRIIDDLNNVIDEGVPQIICS